MTTPTQAAARRVRGRVRTSAEAQATADEYDRAQARLGIHRTNGHSPTSSSELLKNMSDAMEVMRTEFAAKMDEILLRLDAINSRLRNLEATDYEAAAEGVNNTPVAAPAEATSEIESSPATDPATEPSAASDGRADDGQA